MVQSKHLFILYLNDLQDFHLHLFFHIADTLAPVVTIELGEPVTLTCAFTDNFQSTTWIHWYKQNAGDTLKLIVSQQNLIKPTYGPEFSTSRFDVRNTNKMSNLTILKTVQQDEGMYHCIQTDMYGSTCSGTYLSIQGKQYKKLTNSLLLCILMSNENRWT